MGLFEDALNGIGANVSPRELESLAVFVQRHMDGRSRHYHGLSHIFDLAEGGTPVIILGAIYHDIIQLNADTGYSPHVASRLEPYIEVREGKRYIKQFSSSEHLFADMALTIFSRQRGQEVSLTPGSNEFLSALVAIAEIGKFMNVYNMLEILACIEATIPFRIPEKGAPLFQVLEAKVQQVDRQLNLQLGNDKVVHIIQQAVALGNRDVFNFSDQIIENFMFNTWALLPETNVPMRFLRTILTSQYRKAIHGTLKFFEHLYPEIIFHEFKGYPTSAEYKKLLANTAGNLTVSKEYFGAILYSCTLIESISALTGGEVPLSLFLGDVADVGERCSSSAFVYPKIKSSSTFDQTVYDLLYHGGERDGRCLFSGFPVAAYVYGSLSAEFVRDNLNHCQMFFDRKISAHEFLKLHDVNFLSDFLSHLSKIAVSRKSEMSALVQLNKKRAA